MAVRTIDFICEYCDRWCERCAFTHRCTAFPLYMAVAMCDGDVKEAIELALGRPKIPGDTSPPRGREFPGVDASPADIEANGRSLQARHKRVSETAAMTLARAWTTLATDWLRANGARLVASQPPHVCDALQIMRWDAALIGGKVNRALTGRDEADHGAGFDGHRIQNDWNGSAKVALLSIERSIVAWRTVADATGDAAAGGIADALGPLQSELERVFPDARRFRRPGFDQ